MRGIVALNPPPGVTDEGDIDEAAFHNQVGKMCCTRNVVTALALGLCVPAAFADRRHERREMAGYVVAGYVRAVYARETTYNRHYLVEILIDKVEKGDGWLNAGETFVVSCYQPKPATGRETEEELMERSLNVDGGHTSVPAEGDQVRVFVNRFQGTYEGVFPDWVDVLNRAESTPKTDAGKPGRVATTPVPMSPPPIWLWVSAGAGAGLVGGFIAAFLWCSTWGKRKS